MWHQRTRTRQTSGLMVHRLYSRRAGLTRRRALSLLLAGGAVTLLGGGCSSGTGSQQPRGGAGATDYSPRFAGFQPADEPNGDLAKVVWPAFVTRAGPEVQRLYAFQVTNGDLMKYMPCFCGCQFEDNHRSNRDCYVEEVRPDGSVLFDPMAPT